MIWHLELKCDPVAKGRPRFGNGRTYTPAKTLKAERELEMLMLSQFRIEPLDFALNVTVQFFISPPKRTKNKYPCVKPDIDNYTKLVLDAGNGILWKDDGLIVSLHAHKFYSTEPRITISMEAA